MNFVKEYTDYASEMTDAPLIFHTYAAYILGSSCAHNLWFSFGPHKMKLNLYVLLLAGSSTHRKSTALGIAHGLAFKVGAPYLPNEGSHEGLVELLSRQRLGTMWLSEFQTLQKAFAREYMAGYSSFLCDVYDSPEVYTRHLRSGEFTINEPVVSIAAASTLELFDDLAKSGDLRSGLYPRFLFCLANKKEGSDPFPSGPCEVKKNILLAQLKHVRQMKGEVRFPEDVRKEYSIWFGKFENRYAGKSAVDAFVSRYTVMALKVAAIEEAMNNGSQVVSMESLKTATLLIDYTMKKLVDLAGAEFAVDRRDRVTNKVAAFIKERGEVSRSELLRHMHMQSFDLDRVLKTLVDREDIERATVRHEKGGRPTHVLRWVAERNGHG